MRAAATTRRDDDDDDDDDMVLEVVSAFHRCASSCFSRSVSVLFCSQFFSASRSVQCRSSSDLNLNDQVTEPRSAAACPSVVSVRRPRNEWRQRRHPDHPRVEQEDSPYSEGRKKRSKEIRRG